ncbi:MAG TPA: hypothetical protein VH640_08680 [Bryobacteraceae bacterium]
MGGSYRNAVGNLHGWDDGDPFYVNYIGHPMQGAIAGRLFQFNDLRHERTEFGKTPEYWKGKLRATVFAWAFSEQFEIGPLSEASIGHVQAYYPQRGFSDHVVTPTMGFAWMVTEDALDRYVIQHFEDRHQNKWLRLVLRTGLNPGRSVANVLDGRAPWDRASRTGILSYRPQPDHKMTTAEAHVPHEQKPAPFEFSISSGWRQFAGGSCAGGGAEAAYRVRPELQMVLAVNGCKLLDLTQNLSGDGLVFQIGPRWTPTPRGKWSPYAHVLFGGMKITHEQLDPNKEAAVEASNSRNPDVPNTWHDQYTSHEEATGMAISAGTGIDYKLNDALAFRVGSVEYLRSSVGMVGGMLYSSGLQVSTGIVLRLGTW